jgi:hypothetical protein
MKSKGGRRREEPGTSLTFSHHRGDPREGPPKRPRRAQSPAQVGGTRGGSGYKASLVGMAVLKKEAQKVRGTADVVGIISLILLVLIFLRVFGII